MASDQTSELVSSIPNADNQPKWPGWPGYNAFRLIVPVMKAGLIIGKKGETVNKLCGETRARVNVLAAPNGSANYRLVVISAKEEPEADLSPAMVAVMRLSKLLIGLPEGDEHDINSSGSAAAVAFCTLRILVAYPQACYIIGTKGSTIKSIKKSSGAAIQIMSTGEVLSYVNSDERVVELQGEAVKIIKALEYVVGLLRKFLVDYSVIPLLEKNHDSTSVSQIRHTENWAGKMMLNPTMQAEIGSNDHPLSVRNDMLYNDQKWYQDSVSSSSGLSYYRQWAGLSGISLEREPTTTQVAQATLEIPLMTAYDIIGADGSNISYIRSSSGAIITLHESMSSPDEFTIMIRGTPSQVQVAQQLIQVALPDVTGYQNYEDMAATGCGCSYLISFD